MELLDKDVLIFVKLGSAETCSILINAKPDGNVIKLLDTASVMLKAKEWEVNLLVNNTATRTQTNSNVILPTTNAKNVNLRKVVVAKKTRRKLVNTAKLQLMKNSNATEPTKTILNVRNVIKIQRTLNAKLINKLVITVLLHKTSKHATTRPLNAKNHQVVSSSKLVMLTVLTLLHPNSWETGEVSKLRTHPSTYS